MVDLFEYLATCPEDILFAGDINIHMDEDELYANQFKEILDSFIYIQHIDVPTHKMGHTLLFLLVNNCCGLCPWCTAELACHH